MRKNVDSKEEVPNFNINTIVPIIAEDGTNISFVDQDITNNALGELTVTFIDQATSSKAGSMISVTKNVGKDSYFTWPATPGRTEKYYRASLCFKFLSQKKIDLRKEKLKDWQRRKNSRSNKNLKRNKMKR